LKNGQIYNACSFYVWSKFEKMKCLLLLSLFLLGDAYSAIKICEFDSAYSNINKDNNQHFLVDVRSEQAYQRFHIENSFHFKGDSILVKSQLHDHSIVLIGGGSSYRGMETLYDQMKVKGFKAVKILDGGALYFRNRTIESGFSPQLSQLSNLDFIFDEDLDLWLIQDFSGRNLGAEIFAQGQYFNSKNSVQPSTFQNLVQNKGGLQKNILLVVEGQESQLLNDWQKAIDNNVFYVAAETFNLSLTQRSLRHKITKSKQRTDGVEYACN